MLGYRQMIQTKASALLGKDQDGLVATADFITS
jgi:hypothetical protein